MLLYKRVNKQLFVLLVHPGGPFWKNKDIGHWSIPKGEFNDGENAFDAAIREFEEETGTRLDGDFIELVPVKLKSGKVVYAWALEKDIDTDAVESNTFEIEWPPKSGTLKSFPEIDKAAWFTAEEALEKINVAMGDFILQLVGKV
ncbi:NUDIX hydrolase [Flavobacterium algoritolerans]|uniref:NUDIX domain-containing protein n=1 Tax=Flavobacterium algoritolerans TaxID=3041254 RepID=A0ABT6V9B9_9FLAO|nr:NUDIX domain-containing protein [Flavobacterium algoritolerans]MDI5894825.1 NUDIX domain-containing protein [Flavobacterium algoritolerans]